MNTDLVNYRCLELLLGHLKIVLMIFKIKQYFELKSLNDSNYF